MEQSERPAQKRSLISGKRGTILGIIVIVIAVILVLQSGPHEVEHDSLFALPPTPTIVVTNYLGQAPLHQTYQYQGVQMVFTKAEQATKFSDDFKRGGHYVVRVSLNTTNNLKEPLGLDYVALTRLVLPNGNKITAAVASINAAVYPGRPQSGYLDFHVDDPVDLSNLKIEFNKTMLP